MEMRLAAPASMRPHIQRIIDGEYDITYSRVEPVILDIGANVGGFAVWALNRWPDAHVHCYEPVPDNFELLKFNAQAFANRVTLYPVAVGSTAHTHMYLGKNNCGEASFYKGDEQSDTRVDVRVIPPAHLPAANILKMDVEGAETEILGEMFDIDYDVVLLEYHSEVKRRYVDLRLSNYVLVGGVVTSPGQGVLKYLHKRLIRREQSYGVD